MNSYSMAGGPLVAGFVLALAGCDDGLVDVNVNPNAPSDVGAELLLPQSLRSAVELTFGASQMLSHTAIWPQHAVELQYPDEEQGRVRPDRMDLYWDTYYAGALADIQQVIDKGVESGEVNHEAVGRIWRSWIFHVVTDLWGDVPYSEALQGAEDLSPAYDTQQSIYAALIAELDAAAALLDPAASGFGPGDLLFGNDMAAWGKFASSLRMRLAMRMSEVDAGAAQAAFVAAYNAGGFTSNADNASFGWAANPYENPLYENVSVEGRDDHGISATMVDTLTSLSDPRLELYAEPATQDGAYRGAPNGLSDVPLSLANYSRIGDFWRQDGAATPTALMTYSEVLFLQAEAAFRGWILTPGDAQTLYEEGIRANMEQYQGLAANAPTGPEITAYLAEPAVAYNAATGLEQIHLQQWIGLYMNGLEAWSHVRRTDTPSLAAGPDLVVSRIPVRFTYAPLEQSLNAASRTAAVDRQGADQLTTTVWWDVN